MVLRQCAAFYNTIGSQMVESTKPMMLADALEFEKARGTAAGGGGWRGWEGGQRCWLLLDVASVQTGASAYSQHSRLPSLLPTPRRRSSRRRATRRGATSRGAPRPLLMATCSG